MPSPRRRLNHTLDIITGLWNLKNHPQLRINS